MSSAPYVLLGAPAGAGAESRAAGVIRDGAVALDGDHVVDVGPRAEVEARHGRGERLDAVILPALVNAHVHLELSHLAGAVPGGDGLAAWIERFVLARARAGDVGAPAAMAAGAEALLRAGVAVVGDVSNTLGSLPHLARAGIAGSVYHEVFGFSAAFIAEALANAEQARERAGPPPPGLRITPSPHAVYSTHPPTVATLLRGGPASIHVAEDPGERDLCARGDGPFAGIARLLGARDDDLRDLGRSAVAAVAPHLRPDGLAVHVVDLDEEDLALLSRSGATAVLCPRSNLHIGGRLPDLTRLLAAAVPLAIGTDSLASSPSLSPLAELAVFRRAFPALASERLLHLAWNGAAVGAAHVGRLAAGRAPGVVAAPLGGARPDDPCAWLLDVFGAGEEAFAWIARHRPEV